MRILRLQIWWLLARPRPAVIARRNHRTNFPKEIQQLSPKSRGKISSDSVTQQKSLLHSFAEHGRRPYSWHEKKTPSHNRTFRRIDLRHLDLLDEDITDVTTISGHGIGQDQIMARAFTRINCIWTCTHNWPAAMVWVVALSANTTAHTNYETKSISSLPQAKFLIQYNWVR